MIRWFWRIYLPIATILLLGIPLITFGPSIELALNPIRGAQEVRVIERNASRICWTWSFVKIRQGIASDDIDVFTDTPAARGAASAIFERDSGMPWGLASRAVGPGQHALDYCILLPPYVKPTDPVRIRQTAFYPGFLGLWRLPVPFPPVVDPPGAKLP